MRSCRSHPRLLTESDVLEWCAGSGRPIANNTVRSRLSRACTFLRWCVRSGEADPALVEALMGRDNPLRRTPRLYGKVQGTYPARWLTHEQAYGQLLDTCDDSDVGLRDQLLLRLGLAGMRAAEIINLKVGDLRLDDDPPRINWIGKGNRSRSLVPGRKLVALLDAYLARYHAARGAAGAPCGLPPSTPLVCREKTGAGAGQLSWGNRIQQTCSVRRIVLRHANDADLGHMSPHDLRRTAAGILHRSRDEHGAHYFDLLDIQKVLGHSDPATTMRSYLDPIDNQHEVRAAAFLD